MFHDEAHPRRFIFSNLTLSEQRLRIGESAPISFLIARMRNQNEITWVEQKKYDDYPRINRVISNSISEYFSEMSDHEISQVIENLNGFLDIIVLDPEIPSHSSVLSLNLRLPYPNVMRKDGSHFPDRYELTFDDVQAALNLEDTDSNRVYRKLKQMCKNRGATINLVKKESQGKNGVQKTIFTLLISRRVN